MIQKNNENLGGYQPFYGNIRSFLKGLKESNELLTVFLSSIFIFNLIFTTILVSSKEQENLVQNSIPFLRQVNTLDRLSYFQKNQSLRLNFATLNISTDKIIEDLKNQETAKNSIIEISDKSNLVVDMKDVLGKKQNLNSTYSTQDSALEFSEEVKKSEMVKNSQPNQNQKPEAIPNSVPIFNKNIFSIPKIGLINSVLEEASLRNISDIDQKLLYNAVIENQVTHQLCIDGHSYIYGHSEPVTSSEAHFPAVNIFTNLNNLVSGDIIEVRNKDGQVCKYQVSHWDRVETMADQKLSVDQLNFAFNPGEEIALTIQTCQKGSSTVRLLLRAKLVE